MQRGFICLRIHGNASYAEFFAGPDNSQRDFASVGNENFFEHIELSSSGTIN
jgi:hypothetical protein